MNLMGVLRSMWGRISVRTCREALCEWMKLKPMPRTWQHHWEVLNQFIPCESRIFRRLLTNNCPISQWWPCSGLPWRWRERGIRVRFRRGSLRNGYHFYGGQQARKLPNAKKLVRQRKEIGLLNTFRCLGDSNGGYLNPSNIEYQLEDKSGASTRGNSSSKSVY